MWKSPEDRFYEAFDRALESKVRLMEPWLSCWLPEEEAKIRAEYESAMAEMYRILFDSITTNARRDA